MRVEHCGVGVECWKQTRNSETKIRQMKCRKKKKNFLKNKI